MREGQPPPSCPRVTGRTVRGDSFADTLGGVQQLADTRPVCSRHLATCGALYRLGDLGAWLPLPADQHVEVWTGYPEAVSPFLRLYFGVLVDMLG
jgi:hypothetical protein